MGMFDGYKNLNNIYTPNNICPIPPKPECKLDPCIPNKPYVNYNSKGEIIGYWWYQGNTINLEFNIEGEVTYTESEISSELNNTQGIDVNQVGGYITAEDFLKDKQVIIKLYDFRHELIKYRDIDNSIKEAIQIFNGSQGTKYIFVIDELLAKQLGKGNYYLSLTVSSQGYNETIFYQEDCGITIK